MTGKLISIFLVILIGSHAKALPVLDCSAQEQHTKCCCDHPKSKGMMECCEKHDSRSQKDQTCCHFNTHSENEATQTSSTVSPAVDYHFITYPQVTCISLCIPVNTIDIRQLPSKSPPKSIPLRI